MTNNLGFQFNTTYTKLPSEFFSYCGPLTAPAPKIVLFNAELAKEIGLEIDLINDPEKQSLVFSGRHLPSGASPFAQAYAGHQFGHFTILGDGRAHVLGEHITPKDERIDIQLKGSGPTPYSRRGDGRAALSPMLREYIISEAMYHLGIPTTRSLAVVATGDHIWRESWHAGAILTRVASSHIRVGTFEFAATQNDPRFLENILDYTIRRHYPFLSESENKALGLIQIVMEKQIELIVNWMRVGFIHGVMNTDNMTLSGETIDYGPCAFMDTYKLHTVFSSIDHTGRYSFGNQPIIARWNIERLAQALLPLIHNDRNNAIELVRPIIDNYFGLFQHQWLNMMRSKIGLRENHPDDAAIISKLLVWMEKGQVDYTNTFLELMKENGPEGPPYEENSFKEWYVTWKERKKREKESKESTENIKVNPFVIPRNHQVESALDSANNGDFSPLHALLKVLKSPYQSSCNLAAYQAPPGPEEREYRTFCGT